MNTGFLALSNQLLVSLIAIIAFNLIPVAGVLWLQWSLYDIMLLFWLENFVVGIITVLRIWVRRTDDTGATANSVIRLFCVHYGIFFIGHGSFIITFFSHNMLGFPEADMQKDPFAAVIDQLSVNIAYFEQLVSPTGLLIPVLAMVLNHFISFYVHYLKGKEDQNRTLDEIMTSPYGRVVTIHITILVSLITSAALKSNSQILALVLLIGLKSVTEIWMHIREHTQTQSALPADETEGGHE